MAFLVYNRINRSDTEHLINSKKTFSLAGYNLLYHAWELKGKPLNKGWDISSDQLINLWSDNKSNYRTTRFLIDFHPSSKQRIGIIELMHVSAYSFSDKLQVKVTWTPLMLQFRDVFYAEFEKEITSEKKQKMIKEFINPDYSEPFIEFLYLNGDKLGWNWGASGRTNAVFIKDEARDFFRSHF